MKINFKSLPERTADAISDLVYRENYGLGAKLPNELDMAKKLEVSRSTVRTAVQILERRGILEVRRGSGTYISAKLGLTEDPLGLSLIPDKKKLIKDLMQLRMMIEPDIAALAAEFAKSGDIDLLKENCQKTEEAIECGNQYYELDIEFHTLIAKSSRNLVIHNILPAINQTILLQENMAEVRMEKKTAKAHWNIFHAIEKHQCSEAKTAMLTHLIISHERMKAMELIEKV